MSQKDIHALPKANIRTTSSFIRYSFSDDNDQPLSPEDEKSNPPLQDRIVTPSPKRYLVALDSCLKSGRSCRFLLRIVAICVSWTLLKRGATVCGINEHVLGAVDDILRAITCVALAFVGASTYMEIEGKTLVAPPVAIIEEPMVTIATPPQESHPVVHADGDTQVPQTNVPEGSDQTTEPKSSLLQADIDEDREVDHLQMQSTEQRQSSSIDSEHHNQETPQTGIITSELPPKPDSSAALFTVIMRRHKSLFSKFDEFVANPNFAFANEDQAALGNLHLGLRAYKARFFAHSGRHFRPISVRLVSVESSSQGLRAHLGASNPLETCICITGLKMLKEIQEFDKIMSREGYEHLYSPLKLCYEQSHIIRSAGSGSYNINPSGTETLCGSLVVFEDSDGLQRKSTVGGMVEIDDQTFGLTTSHRPEDDMFPDNNVPSLADLIRAFGDEEDHVSEPAQHASSSVSLTVQQEDDEALDTPASRASHSTRDLEKGSSGKSTSSLYSYDTWDDWDLLPIEPANRLPNTVPTSKSRAYSPKGIKRSGKYIYVVRHFDRMSFDNAMPWSVFIISGMSGIVDGFLSSSPSYTLSGVDGPQELWNIRLKQTDLQAGDSGSWVVRENDHSLLGLVVARSTGSAYMISWKQVTQSIEKKNNLVEGAVKLPTWASTWMVSRERLPKKHPMPATTLSRYDKHDKKSSSHQQPNLIQSGSTSISFPKIMPVSGRRNRRTTLFKYDNLPNTTEEYPIELEGGSVSRARNPDGSGEPWPILSSPVADFDLLGSGINGWEVSSFDEDFAFLQEELPSLERDRRGFWHASPLVDIRSSAELSSRHGGESKSLSKTTVSADDRKSWRRLLFWAGMFPIIVLSPFISQPWSAVIVLVLLPVNVAFAFWYLKSLTSTLPIRRANRGNHGG